MNISKEQLEAKSKWCVDFLKKIRKEFLAIKNAPWYDYLLYTVDPEFPNSLHHNYTPSIPRDAQAAEAGLESFLSNFSHLNLPIGAYLDVTGRNFPGLGGHVNLTIGWSNQDPIPVEELKCDPLCVESIWEKEVLSWVSSQFCLWWHAAYHEHAILLGTAANMESEIKDYDFGDRFITSIEEKPDNVKEQYFATDFSPNVKIVNGKPRLTYHTFSAFSGIDRIVIGSDVPKIHTTAFPYHCGICF